MMHISGQAFAVPLTERCRIPTQIDHYVEDCPARASHELGLKIWGSLEMHATQYSRAPVVGD